MHYIMIKTGLVSITFRDLSVEKIIHLVSEAGLDAIEWGGDLHVPHGDIERACEVRKLCETRKIATPSYGSYYRAGIVDQNAGDFESVLASADALGANTIRVWAGNRASEDISCEIRKTIVDDLLRIAKLAAKKDISISLEYHARTLTDSQKSTTKLIEELAGSGIYFYWQPPNGVSEEECIQTLNTVLPYLSHVHTFHWKMKKDGDIEMRPLSEGVAVWRKYFEIISEKTATTDHYSFIEFVKDGSVNQFIEDAKTLKKLIY